MRPSLKSTALLPAFALSAVLLGAGCESTQEKSAKLESEGAQLAKLEKVDIGATNRDIEVLDKFLLTDQYGSAIVLRLKNDSPQGQIDVPIGVDVRNAKGKSIYKNDLEGLEEGLQKLQIIEPNGETYWVNDQVLVTEKPKSVEVEVGRSDVRWPSSIPEIEMTSPQLVVDPVDGIEVDGKVFNRSNIEQTDLLLYAVATKGNEVVAAGRGLIPKLKVDDKGEQYNIFFIGDPRGADIQVFATPNTFE